MKSFTSLSWHTWIVVNMPLVADGGIYKLFVVYEYRRSQASGGRESRINAFVGIRRSLFTSLWWQTESFASL